MNDDIFKFCRIGDLRSVKYLVEETKVDTEIQNETGNTPLHIASWCSHIEIVKYLVEEAKVDTGVQNVYGSTPLHSASKYGQLKIVKYLVEETKVNTETLDKHGDTPLHYASVEGLVEIIKYFIRHDVDTSIKNNDGYTFLDFLGGEKEEEIEEMIEDLHWRKSNVKSRRF